MSLLQIKNLTKHFKGVTAVNNLNFEVCEGQIVGLIGPNGAGKSTVFDMMSAIRPPDGSSPLPDEGEIIFKRKNIVGMQAYTICKLGITRTFQISKLILEMTVLENVFVAGVFGKDSGSTKESLIKESERICLFLGLGEKMNTLASNLTIIERKRLELARALSTKPTLLLLDEVMAGLTPHEIDRVCDMIKKIRDSHITIIVVEHVMQAIMAISTKIVVMDYGEKIAEGIPKEIVDNPKVIEAYFGKEDI